MGFEAPIVIFLNHWAGSSQPSYVITLILGDQAPWLLAVLLLVGLWFYGVEEVDEEDSLILTRVENRKRALLIILAMAIAMTVARYVGYIVGRPEPYQELNLVTPLPPGSWGALYLSASSIGAFPGEISSYWTVLTLGLWRINRYAGTLAGGLGLLIVLLRIAAGFQWPTDILGGVLLGTIIYLLIFRFRAYLKWLVNPTVQLFEWLPFLMYPLGLLFLSDAVHKLSGFYSLITQFFGVEVPG